MTKWLGAGVLLTCAAVGLWWSFSQGLSGSPETHPHVAKDFEAQDRQGRIRKLSDFKGQVLLLHFWATWCPPCIEELPGILEFAKQFKSSEIRMIAVSLDRNWETAMKIFPKDLPPNTISLLDSEMKSSEAYGSYKFPETYLIDKDFNIKMKWVGPQNWNTPETVAYFRKLSR